MTETRYDVVFSPAADGSDAHSVTLPDGYITRVGMTSGGVLIGYPGGMLMTAGYTTGSNRDGLVYRGANNHYYGPLGLLGLRCYSGETLYCQAALAADATRSAQDPVLSIWVETDLSAPPPGLAQPLIDSDPTPFATSISLAAPAAGAEYATISSTHTEYRVVGAKLPLTTDSASANRWLRVNGVQMRDHAGSWDLAASSYGEFSEPVFETPWARSIVFETRNLQAGDQYGAGTLYVQERALL